MTRFRANPTRNPINPPDPTVNNVEEIFSRVKVAQDFRMHRSLKLFCSWLIEDSYDKSWPDESKQILQL